MSEVMTIRVDRKTKTRLEKLAKAMERTKSYLAAEAIRTYVELNEWQIGEIKAALKEADAGDFATPEEVAKVMNKWRRWTNGSAASGSTRDIGIPLQDLRVRAETRHVGVRLGRGLSPLRMAMNRIDPEHRLGPLHRLDIEIDHHRLLVAAHHHAG